MKIINIRRLNKESEIRTLIKCPLRKKVYVAIYYGVFSKLFVENFRKRDLRRL
jgi:hypothetical protein